LFRQTRIVGMRSTGDAKRASNAKFCIRHQI
jgi:hypothetical protein